MVVRHEINRQSRYAPSRSTARSTRSWCGRSPTLLIGIVGGLIVGMTSVGSGSLIIVLLLLLYPTLAAGQLVGTDLVQAVPLVGAAALGHLLFGDVEFATRRARSCSARFPGSSSAPGSRLGRPTTSSARSSSWCCSHPARSCSTHPNELHRSDSSAPRSLVGVALVDPVGSAHRRPSWRRPTSERSVSLTTVPSDRGSTRGDPLRARRRARRAHHDRPARGAQLRRPGALQGAARGVGALRRRRRRLGGDHHRRRRRVLHRRRPQDLRPRDHQARASGSPRRVSPRSTATASTTAPAPCCAAPRSGSRSSRRSTGSAPPAAWRCSAASTSASRARRPSSR